MMVEEHDDGEPAKQSRDEPSGIGDAVDITAKLAGATFSLTRRLTTDAATHAASVGRDVVHAARSGHSPPELAGLMVNGWVQGVRKVLDGDNDLKQMGEQVGRAARPVASLMPGSGPSPHPAGQEQHRDSVDEVHRGLKERGHELLYRSTAVDDPEEHPALAVILHELSPDEARLIRFLATQGPQAVVDLVAHNPMTRKQREMLHHFSLIGREAGCIRPVKVPVYLDNLVRLGLVHIRPYRLRGPSNYELLYAQPEITEVQKPEGRLVRLKIVHKGVELSAFGTEMYQQCLETEQYQICPPPKGL